MDDLNDFSGLINSLPHSFIKSGCSLFLSVSLIDLVEGTIGNVLFSSHTMDNGRLVFCHEFYEG